MLCGLGWSFISDVGDMGDIFNPFFLNTAVESVPSSWMRGISRTVCPILHLLHFSFGITMLVDSTCPPLPTYLHI